MSKFPSFTPKKLITFLRKQGFFEDHQTGSHIVFYHPGTKRRAVVPMHSKDLPKGTLFSILKEAGFSKKAYFEKR